jgi:uncharacterized protein YdiU (UPF0061 family)
MALPATIEFSFDNSYSRLPERFFARLPPTPVPTPDLVRVNAGLAAELGLDVEALASADGADILSGSRVPQGAEPLAMVYGGHQFGHWAGRLGDGRAILLGEVVGHDGIRRDIQLKGAGQTPFSRMGDGRAVIGPVLREYVVSEAMHALGIPTTRALAAAYTGETVQRERPLPGAVLTRVARSHVRVGTFQYFAYAEDHEALRVLADYVIARHYPQAAESDHPYTALLECVVEAQAHLVAQWAQVGFIHGVMNTDNMQIAGETIDYGPCAFMDGYHPDTVYSSIDRGGRYAYSNQPRAAHWNLACLAQALLPLLDDDAASALEQAQAVIDGFPARYDAAWLEGMRRKLGLQGARDEDAALIDDLLELMATGRTDFTLTFRHLCDLTASPAEADATLRSLFAEPTAFDAWAARWRSRLAGEGSDDAARQRRMAATNPAFIPRNHLVEAAIQAALEGSHAEFDALLAAVTRPFEDQAANAHLMLPPAPHEVVQQTFCGT